MSNPWKIHLQACEIMVIHDVTDEIVKLGIHHRHESVIADKGFIRLDELPPEWLEAHGMQRVGGPGAAVKDVILFVQKVVPLLFELSEGAPIICQCSKRHALFYKKVLDKHGINVTFVGGSLAGKPPITDMSNSTGGSDDEQIVMFEDRQECYKK